MEKSGVKTGTFAWHSYLRAESSVAAPQQNFYQSVTPPVNNFEVGYHLKVTDPKAPDHFCLAKVTKVKGPRVRLGLKFTSYTFWRMCDAEDMAPLDEKLDTAGVGLEFPVGIEMDQIKIAEEMFASKLTAVLKKCKKAPAEWFLEPPQIKPNGNLFRHHQKLEVVDTKIYPNCCSQSNIWPGTIVKVDGTHITVGFDGWGEQFDVTVPYYSRDIFPCGWSSKAGHPLCWTWEKPNGNKISSTPMASSVKPEITRESPDDLSKTVSKFGGRPFGRKSAAKGQLSELAKAKFCRQPSDTPTDDGVELSKSANALVNFGRMDNGNSVKTTAYLNAECRIGPLIDKRHFQHRRQMIFGPLPLSELFVTIAEAVLVVAKKSRRKKSSEQLLALIPPEQSDPRKYKAPDGSLKTAVLPRFKNDENIFWDRVRMWLREMKCCENVVSPTCLCAPCVECQPAILGKKGKSAPLTQNRQATCPKLEAPLTKKRKMKREADTPSFDIGKASQKESFNDPKLEAPLAKNRKMKHEADTPSFDIGKVSQKESFNDPKLEAPLAKNRKMKHEADTPSFDIGKASQKESFNDPKLEAPLAKKRKMNHEADTPSFDIGKASQKESFNDPKLGAPLAKKRKMKNEADTRSFVIGNSSTNEEVVMWLKQFDSIHTDVLVKIFQQNKITGAGTLKLKSKPTEFLQTALGLEIGSALELEFWLDQI